MCLVPAYLGLGSNLDQPIEQLWSAVRALVALEKSSVVGMSALYRSHPLGPTNQPDFINAVVALETGLPPLTLLDALQKIEQQQGRQRTGMRWGARTLDIDILTFGARIIDLPRLQVPHYHLHARAFVLYPLAELAPELILADGRALQDLLKECPYSGIERLK